MNSNDAFVSIYQKLKLPVYRYVLYKVRNTTVAEDITSECFLRLFKEFQTNPQVSGYAQPWLYRIALNLIIDRARSLYHQKTVTQTELEAVQERSSDEGASEKDPFVAEYEPYIETLVKEEQFSLAYAMLQKLKDADKEIIELRLLQQLPFHDIGVMLHIQEPAAKMRFGRAMDKLRLLIDKKGELGDEPGQPD